MRLSNITFLLLSFFILTFTESAAAKTKRSAPEGDIKWSTIEKAISDSKNNSKKFILVELFTDWCGWCKKMDEGTFTEASIVALMNANFTAVKFNAESQAPLTFNGKTYSFNKTGSRGTNQFALDIGSNGGKLGYPTIVVLDADGNKLQAFPGYKDVETMSSILRYYQSGSYKTMDFQQFQSGQ